MTGDEEYLVCDLEMSKDNLPLWVTKIEVAERFKFYQRKQKEDETIVDFVAALWNLSKDCQFGSFLSSALRDAFVIGLVDSKIQKKLLTKPTLTLGTAVKMATSMKAPTQKSKQLQHADIPIHQVWKGGQCWHCGDVKSDHCLFQKTECFRCKKLSKQVSKCTQTKIKAIIKVSAKENIKTSKASSKPLTNSAKMPTKPGEKSSNLKSPCNQTKPAPKEILSSLKKKKKIKPKSCLLVENSLKVGKIVQETSSKPEGVSSNLESTCNQIVPVSSIETLSPLKEKKTKSYLLVENSCIVETISQGTSTNKTTDTEIDSWFDCIDPNLCYSISSSEPITQNEASETSKECTEILALDCEMVRVGVNRSKSALARVSIVNQFGVCIYDKYVAPGTKVTDYRTRFSGIRPHNLKNAIDSRTVRQEVAAILRGRILVGHSLNHDLNALKLQHPNSNIRDTSQYKVFQAIVNGATPSLKKLAHHFLGIEIQSGEHCSIQDAQAAMRLYNMFRQQWETDFPTKKKKRNKKIGNGEKISTQTSTPANNTNEPPIS